MREDLSKLESKRRSSDASPHDAVTVVDTGSDRVPTPRADVGSSVGRYVVLEEVGRGGMGRVLRAYDPKLQREVALKQLRGAALGPSGATRLVAEARAMAKLSHPNVVAVYDVEEPDGRVVLVMEYLAGQTLMDWLAQTPRPWQEVVAAFAEAGRGLAAAHAVSLLHRDFKPANVLVAGRTVKVTDFGLAKLRSATEDRSWAPPIDGVESSSGLGSEDLTEAGVVLGTARYMAPEQHRGEELTAAADQYAFCVALWEALRREPLFAGEDVAREKAKGPPPWPGGPTPRNIAEAVRRGLSPDPAQRWPTMDALLHALAQNPAARRRRWLFVGAGVLIVGVLGWQWSVAREQRCTRAVAAAHLQGVWDDDRRGRVHDAIVGIGATYATAVGERTEQMLDAYAEDWIGMHVDACTATSVRGEQSTEVLDRRMACLQRARVDLDAVVRVLADADAGAVRKAHELTDSLRPLSRCADVEALQADVEPPLPEEAEAVEAAREHLALARAASRAGQYDRATSALDAAEASLNAVEYGPVRTELAIVQGDLLNHRGEYAQAEAFLKEGLTQAARLHQAEEVQDAAARLLFLVGYKRRRFDESVMYEDLALGLAAGDPIREAAADSRLAAVRSAAGAHEEAVPLHERALAIREEALGPDHPHVAVSLNNLGAARYAQGAYEEAATLHERALAIREKALGPDHPEVALSLNNLANARIQAGAYEEAGALYERALAIQRKALGADHPHVAMTLNNLAYVRSLAGAEEDAAALLEEALAIREKALGPDHPDVAITLANLGHNRAEAGEHEEAAKMLQRALAIQEKALGADHPEVALSLGGLADVRRATGAYAEAARLWERAVSIVERALGPEHPEVVLPLERLARLALDDKRPRDAVRWAERAVKVLEANDGPATELARAHVLLARALVAAGGSKLRAIADARAARQIYVEAGEAGRDGLAEVDAFLHEHGG